MTDKERLGFIDFIKTELKSCSGYVFIDKTIDEMLAAISPHKTFNFDKFYEWFISKNIKFMTSPLAFLKKCALEDIKKGNFDEVYENSRLRTTISIQTLLNAMRKHQIEIIDNHDIYICIVENYIVENALMTIPDLIEWNHKAVSYLAHKGKTSKDFIYLFQNTRNMRALKLPFKEFELEFEREKKSWKQLLEEINPASTAIEEEEMPFEIGVESETQNEKINNTTMETI